MDEKANETTDSCVIVPHSEFAEDLELRLGRANGNVFHRKPGVEGVHDGQIMVRLKKKRYIIIDYGIVPTPSDLQAAAISQHVACPDGAGKAQCVSPSCCKVGVPVLLYDSEPTETASLYLRSGLCFTCQRNLNEKRRTQRKRKSDTAPLTFSDSSKKAKVTGGDVLELTPDAIVINGPIQGVKRHSEGHTQQDIVIDLQSNLQSAIAEVQRLAGEGQTTSESAVAYAAAAAAAVNPDLAAMESAATTAAVDAASTELLQKAEEPSQQTGTQASISPAEDTNSIYEKALTTLTKSVCLLHEWKAAWDASNKPATSNPENDAALAAAISSEATALLAAKDRKENSDKKEDGTKSSELQDTSGGTEGLKTEKVTSPEASDIQRFEV
mmetsp:Transcript_31769/g.46855  ORF Transcript_31769/g.46855 Transcript_31769/m.46855 type:complete len:384 (+) Transcript_31769:322-1473(+)|eukprot:CAMPEP_0194206234 /NCGR_PEP_ID=MMETSP0156-20130528/5319_1 /TAXON_ID=33649 /ORGANISM="Thalassionema nitzschioides, Strain L26-B" /LENGTH=383 /DNA_ID=CAMNT_0038932707 /DNA_START=262 /DNA_END=1413 /DNA_ORIENTATION=+